MSYRYIKYEDRIFLVTGTNRHCYLSHNRFFDKKEVGEPKSLKNISEVFVVFTNNGAYLESSLEKALEHNPKRVYGAIWVDKGIKFIAEYCFGSRKMEEL